MSIIRLDNPVLMKEMRVRMRGARAYWILFGFLSVLSVVLVLSYGVWLQTVARAGFGSSQVSSVGIALFGTLSVSLAALVLFITPAITSGAITIEKEQRTLDMLFVTRISCGRIVAGKLIAALLFTGLLLLSSLPLVSICFLLGGVDPGMVLSCFVSLLALSLLLGAAGLMCSSTVRSTSVAVVVTYLTAVLPAIPLIAVAAIALFSGRGQDDPLSESFLGSNFLGVPVPQGAALATYVVILALILAGVAASRLDTRPERHAPYLRGMTALLISLISLNLFIWWDSAWAHVPPGSAGQSSGPSITAFAIALLPILIVTPIFATGELLPSEARKFGRYMFSGFSPRGLMTARMASGLPFMLGLTLLVVGLYAGAGAWAAHAAAASPRRADLIGPLLPAAVLALATVGGLSLFCMLLSVICRSRWVAIGGVVCCFLVWCTPFLVGATHMPGSNEETPLINLLYLEPLHEIGEMAVKNIPNVPPGHILANQLALDPIPDYLVSTVLWIAIGGLSLAATSLFAQYDSRGRGGNRYESGVSIE